jgi:hypothetical protein
MEGDEKLRLPRPPEENPPPALAHADDSIARHTAKLRMVKKIRAPSALLLPHIFISPHKTKIGPPSTYSSTGRDYFYKYNKSNHSGMKIHTGSRKVPGVHVTAITAVTGR